MTATATRPGHRRQRRRGAGSVCQGTPGRRPAPFAGNVLALPPRGLGHRAGARPRLRAARRCRVGHRDRGLVGLRRGPCLSRDDHRRQGCPRPWPRCPADGCAAGSGASAHPHAQLDGRGPGTLREARLRPHRRRHPAASRHSPRGPPDTAGRPREGDGGSGCRGDRAPGSAGHGLGPAADAETGSSRPGKATCSCAMASRTAMPSRAGSAADTSSVRWWPKARTMHAP